MKITLRKSTNVDGAIWFHIMQDYICLKSFHPNEEYQANEYYNLCVKKAKEGYPKDEIIKEVKL